MKRITRHLARCIVAGIVFVLPVGGTVLGTVYLEKELAKSWVGDQAFYFPGLALLLTAVGLYVLGLAVSTFVGRFLLRLVDSLLSRLPALGRLYATVKQILGYGEGEDAVFRRVVLVENEVSGSRELGLVTAEVRGDSGDVRLAVFVPGAPNPTTGRLLLAERERVRPLDLPVNEAFKTLLSVGANSPKLGGSG